MYDLLPDELTTLIVDLCDTHFTNVVFSRDQVDELIANAVTTTPEDEGVLWFRSQTGAWLLHVFYCHSKKDLPFSVNLIRNNRSVVHVVCQTQEMPKAFLMVADKIRYIYMKEIQDATEMREYT